MNRPLRGPVAPSPPVDFPVYGLEPSWPGSRWLESFGDRIGDPVTWVSLAHLGYVTGSLVFVETFSRTRVDLGHSERPLAEVAGYACTVLINMTLPEHSQPFPDGFLPALVNLSERQSEQCEQWPQTRWRVDGRAVSVRVWRFAGGWAAVSEGVEGVYLAAAGMGTEPDGLSLAVVRDGDAYHFDLSRPLHPETLAASRRRDGWAEKQAMRRKDFHADQLRLMSDTR
jgi:hypothetical protein